MNTRAFQRSEAKQRASVRAVRFRAALAREGPDGREQGELRRVLVWDFPTRLFHWLLVVAVAAAVISGELGGAWMAWHGRAGLAIVGLVAFRLVWGVVGSTHARFASFAPTPARLRAYLRGRWDGAGHNPLGALSVIALLALLTSQAASGLFASDDIAFTGPLYVLVDDAMALRLTGLHRQLANVLLMLTGLHVLAIGAYLVIRKVNLVAPMVTGYKRMRGGTPASRGGPVALVAALLVAALAVAAAGGAFTRADAPAGPQPLPSAAPAW